jgi:hypothetical protein
MFRSSRTANLFFRLFFLSGNDELKTWRDRVRKWASALAADEATFVPVRAAPW